MSMDWVVWVIRAIIIVVAIIVAIIVGKRKYYFGIIVVGITAFIMGVIFLIISSITDLRFDYSLYLTATGVIVILTGWVLRNRGKKNC